MNARKMFEREGYTLAKDTDHYLIYRYYDVYKGEIRLLKEVAFNRMIKEVFVTNGGPNCHAILIDMKMLDMINTQCKEEGWI